MKDVMNFPECGELKAISHFQYLGDYLKRSISPWGKLGSGVAWES